jgi:hypothetical protein
LPISAHGLDLVCTGADITAHVALDYLNPWRGMSLYGHQPKPGGEKQAGQRSCNGTARTQKLPYPAARAAGRQFDQHSKAPKRCDAEAIFNRPRMTQ